MSSMKIIILGTSGVGKTSTIESFTSGGYSGKTKPTIGAEYKTKQMVIEGVSVNIGLWDTAGQERFCSLPQHSYRDIHGVVLMYDVTEKSSLTKLDTHINQLKINVSMDEVICLLIGNKIDQERKVTMEEGQAFAQKNGMMYMELSAKTQEGLLDAFQELVRKILRSRLYNPNEKSTVVLREAYANAQGSCCYNNNVHVNLDMSGTGKRY